jgi:hypothetical protein
METIQDLINAAQHRIDYPLDGYSAGESQKALRHLEAGRITAAACCRVEPEWARRVTRVHQHIEPTRIRNCTTCRYEFAPDNQLPCSDCCPRSSRNDPAPDRFPLWEERISDGAHSRHYRRTGG